VFEATQKEAAALGIQVMDNAVREPTQLESGVAAFAREPNGALTIVQSPFAINERERVVAVAARYQLPAVYPLAAFVEVGGLVSYGVNVPVMWKAAAGYMDRILRGSSLRDLPVQEPSEPEITINLKTARRLNLSFPAALRGRVTRVFE
jgi:putative ABC transport system substrate-binding protein